MRCEDVLLELGSREKSELAQAHLEGCADCRLAAEAVAGATLPPPSSAERLGLDGLASATQAGWLLREHHRLEGSGRVRQLARLALAAGVGALLATGVQAWHHPGVGAPVPGPSVTFQPVALEVPVLPEPELDEPNLSDDEVFFEVSWPQPTEGDL